MGILEVLDGIVVACAANAKDDGDVEATLGAFHFALSSRLKLLDSAVDVLDDVGVKEYRSKSCERVFWKIKSSKDKEYTVSSALGRCRSGDLT